SSTNIILPFPILLLRSSRMRSSGGSQIPSGSRVSSDRANTISLNANCLRQTSNSSQYSRSIPYCPTRPSETYIQVAWGNGNRGRPTNVAQGPAQKTCENSVPVESVVKSLS